MDDCLTVIYQLTTMDYNSLNYKAGPYYKCSPPWGGLEGLRIGRAFRQQQYQQSVKCSKTSLFLNQKSSTTNTNRLFISIDKQLHSHNPVLSDSFEWKTEENDVEFTVYLKLTHHKFVFVWYFWEL